MAKRRRRRIENPDLDVLDSLTDSRLCEPLGMHLPKELNPQEVSAIVGMVGSWDRKTLIQIILVKR